ncbi:MAG TPA: gluconeogenesis factor YvcK family protein [Acidimicrobiales bacterium]|nr:gluconeogenesis factor YvcK family protein [Acidimicrobiales bacterium]
MSAPKRSGPKVVALGGGHGTAVTLQAARRYAGDVTAIVSVADDGGSSGRLRQTLGIPAPGDLRRCLVALSDPSAHPLAQAFEHRFDDGHALGNLVIAGLTAATGSFIGALEEAARLLDAQGTVLPATSDPVVLKAVADRGEVEGQVNVANAGRITHVGIVPPDAAPPAQALEAIAAADQLVLGPGSLFTSVLAVIAVPAIRQALADARAPLVYLCNLRESAETLGFDVAAHLSTLVAHGLEPDVVLYDPTHMAKGGCDTRCVEADLAASDGHAHDPGKLARALADLLG